MIAGYCRRIHHDIYIPGRHVRILFIVYFNSFGFQLPGQICFHFIIATHFPTMKLEIPGKGTHSNTADPNEINLPYMFEFQHFLGSDFNFAHKIFFHLSMHRIQDLHYLRCNLLISVCNRQGPDIFFQFILSVLVFSQVCYSLHQFLPGLLVPHHQSCILLNQVLGIHCLVIFCTQMDKERIQLVF